MRLFVVAARRGRQEQVFVVQKLLSTSLGTAARRYEFNFQFCARSSWGTEQYCVSGQRSMAPMGATAEGKLRTVILNENRPKRPSGKT